MAIIFTYQKNSRYFAQISHGLESLGSEELESLGATGIKEVYGGLLFIADPATLYRINYGARLCSRVLAPLLRFDCHSTKYLYRTAYKLPWLELLGPENTFAVSASISHSRIRHSRHAALVLKDAVVDVIREASGDRPNVDTENPDVGLHLHIENNRATISLDTSGGSLHRRGYRLETVEAPMQETLAAAIIRLTGWNGAQPLVDPMCGSGTLLCEALMHYCRIPSGYLRRRFGFENLPDFDPKIWKRVRTQEDAKIRSLPDGLISGSDASGKAVESALANCRMLPHGTQIVLRKQRFSEIKGLSNRVIICNPPYGIRLGKKGAASDLLKDFGDFLKQRCTGSTAYIYLGERELSKSVGLRPEWKKPLKTGGLDGLLLKYELY